MQSDVSSQRAPATVVGGQTGAKPAAFAGVATRKGMGAEVPWGAGEVGRAKQQLWGGDTRGNPGPQREKREETGAANQGRF